MKPYKRTDRVSNLIQRELAVILQRHANDWQCVGVTVTYVKVAPDLSSAKVYVTSFLQEQLKQVLLNLNNMSVLAQKELGKAIKLKRTPRLNFIYDESIERGSKLSEIIDSAVAADRKQDGDDEGL